MYEHILPVGFYCQIAEPQVLVKVFKKILEFVDK